MYIHLSQNLDAATLIPRCMLEGRTLVITDLDTGKLAADELMMDVLACRRSLYKAKAKMKIMVLRQLFITIILYNYGECSKEALPYLLFFSAERQGS